jgi:hypothetical protein
MVSILRETEVGDDDAQGMKEVEEQPKAIRNPRLHQHANHRGVCKPVEPI